MNACIISIGNELLSGHTINTNASFIAQELQQFGIEVKRIITVADKHEEIISSIAEASRLSDFAIATGGLGPTTDDITKKAICEYFNTSLVFNKEVWQQIEQSFKNRNIILSSNNRSQAEIPEGAIYLKNKLGTAPGLILYKNDFFLISLPGVPFEMETLMKTEVLPYLLTKIKFQPPFIKTYLFTEISESLLAEYIQSWDSQLNNAGCAVAYLPQAGLIKLKLTTPCLTSTQQELLNEFDNFIRKKLYSNLAADEDIPLSQVIGNILMQQHKTLATAESCTGGYLAHLITSIPGSSNYFKGSVIAYANEIKINLLHVDSNVIEKHGAVSKWVVEQMAKSILQLLNVDYSIAVSGIAGPDGGSKEKPVGTTWIAIASHYKIESQKFIFGADRLRNIERTAMTALSMLRRLLLNNG